MKRLVKVLLSISLLGSVVSGCAQSQIKSNVLDKSQTYQPVPVENLQGPFQVTKVTDGDTIHILRNGLDERVRIIGLNTPEVHSKLECYGPEASDFAHREFDGKSVYLESDSTQAGSDRFGRTLAHIWTTDRKIYALEAIKNGYGKEFRYAKQYHHRNDFLEAQKQAKSAKAGLWQHCSDVTR